MNRASCLRASNLSSALLSYAFFSRPVAKFLKLLHRVFFGKTRRHSIDLWPYLKIKYDTDGVLECLKINNQLVPLIPVWPPVYIPESEQTLHLIATGPSISNIDYTRMNDGVFMGVNGAIELAQRFSLNFDYYVISDYTFVTERSGIVTQVLSDKKTILFTTPKCLLYIYKTLGSSAVRCRICVIELIGQKYNQSKDDSLEAARNVSEVMVSSDPSIGFSQHIGKGVYEGGTVAYVGLQVAAHLGYKKIYLHGIDLGNADKTPRFYETWDDRAKTNLVKELDSVILPSFKMAAPVLQSRGISVYNLSPQSSLDDSIFKKISAQSLYV